eukprot:scaffold64502_cov66-Phaeocystis_antarctica.AAC.3
MIDRCSVRVGDTQLSIYLSICLSVYLPRTSRAIAASSRCLCRVQGGAGFGQLALWRLLSAPQIMPQVAPSFAATASASR